MPRFTAPFERPEKTAPFVFRSDKQLKDLAPVDISFPTRSVIATALPARFRL